MEQGPVILASQTTEPCTHIAFSKRPGFGTLTENTVICIQAEIDVLKFMSFSLL